MAGTLYATMQDYKGKVAIASVEVAEPTMEKAKKWAEFQNANSCATCLGYGMTMKDVIPSDAALNGPYDRVYQRAQLLYNDVSANESRRFSVYAPNASIMAEDQECTSEFATTAQSLLRDIGAIQSTANYNGSSLISKPVKTNERRKV